VTRFVLLLRGINVGTGRKVPMAALRDLLTGLGHQAVATYIQSGNVVLSATSLDVAAIEATLHTEFGFRIAVIVRTHDQLVAALAANPFIPDGADPSRVGIVFLGSEPGGAQIAADPYLPDRFAVLGSEVHLHCPHGFGRTKLSNDLFERRLDVVATTRNWNTTTRLVDLAAG
jgi:uncharacterized protein (DUF1697 family)